MQLLPSIAAGRSVRTETSCDDVLSVLLPGLLEKTL